MLQTKLEYINWPLLLITCTDIDAMWKVFHQSLTEAINSSSAYMYRHSTHEHA